MGNKSELQLYTRKDNKDKKERQRTRKKERNRDINTGQKMRETVKDRHRETEGEE